MNRMLIFTMACGLVATAALAQTARPRAPQSALAATGETEPAPSAQDFVEKVAISDMFEIQSSQLALSKQPDKDTKPFAQRSHRSPKDVKRIEVVGGPR
jgi:putative membrane protein